MPSGQAPLPRLAGPKSLAIAHVAALVDAQPGDAAAGRLDDVEELFLGVEPDLVGELEAVGDDAERAVLVPREISVGEVGAERVHPVLDARRHRDPDAVLANPAGRNSPCRSAAPSMLSARTRRRAVPRHQLEAVGAEIRDEEVAVPGEGQPVRQRALEIARRFGAGAVESARTGCCVMISCSPSADPDDAAARVGHPERSVGSARMHSGRCRSWPT